jgi:hypothetical protein
LQMPTHIRAVRVTAAAGASGTNGATSVSTRATGVVCSASCSSAMRPGMSGPCVSAKEAGWRPLNSALQLHAPRPARVGREFCLSRPT